MNKPFYVTTKGNCLLAEFDTWEEAIIYCKGLDIHVKLVDRYTGITIDYNY